MLIHHPIVDLSEETMIADVKKLYLSKTEPEKF